MTPSDSAYRGVDTVEALVRGNPAAAVRALRRAVARGVATLVALGAIAVAHVAVMSSPAMEGWYLVHACAHRWSHPRATSCAEPPAQTCSVSILFQEIEPSFSSMPCHVSASGL